MTESRRSWLLIFGIMTFLGLMSFSTRITADRLDLEEIELKTPLVDEMTGAYSIFVLLPAMFRFFPHARFSKARWWRILALHLAASVVFGVCHTLLMTASRALLYPLIAGKPYSMGDVFYRFLMEYHKQVLMYVLIAAVFYVAEYYRHARERERRAAELELQAIQLQSRLAQSQLQSLRGQLQPHFLFNTLNMISSEMYDNPGKADKMIARLSAMLRKSLESSGQQKITLQEELEFLDLYLDIMRARFEDRLNVSVDVDPEARSALIPSFLLQPLVENAIKHNDQGGEDNVCIAVRAHRREDQLCLEVADNGPGWQMPADVAVTKGVGLSNTRERLERLYGASASIDLGTEDRGGAAIRIFIPLEQS